VVGLSDKAGRAGNAAARPGNDKLVGVMGMEEEDVVLAGNVAKGPAAEGHDAQVRCAGQAPAEDLVRGWVDRRESISQRFPESLSYFGDDLGAIVIVEH